MAIFNIRSKINSLVSEDRLVDALNELDIYSDKISQIHKDQVAVLYCASAGFVHG